MSIDLIRFLFSLKIGRINKNNSRGTRTTTTTKKGNNYQQTNVHDTTEDLRRKIKMRDLVIEFMIC